MTIVEGAGVSDQDMTESEEFGWLTGVSINGEESDTRTRPYNDVFIGQKEVEIQPEYTFNQSAAQGKHGLNVSYATTRPQARDLEILENGAWDSEGAEWDEVNESPFDWDVYEKSIPLYFGNTDDKPWDDPLTRDLWTFTFDVSEEANPGIYRIPLKLRADIYNASAETWSGQQITYEYVYIELAGNAKVAANDVTVTPGTEFEETSVPVENQGEQDLTHVNLTLDVSESDLSNQGVFIHDPKETTYMKELPHGSSRNFPFRITTPLDASPGNYEVEYTLMGTREEDDVKVTENGTVMITVEKVVELTADIHENEVMQGTSRETFTVEFTNTGNLDLEKIEIKAGTDGDYFFTPIDHYDDGQPSKGETPFKDIGDLRKGESETTDFVFGMKKQLQIGKHKINFDYSAYYYDEDGEITSERSRYVETGTISDPEGLLAPSEEPMDFLEVTENPEYTPLDCGEIGILEGHEIQEIELTDSGYQEIKVEIENNAEVDYGDVNVEMEAEGTPFTTSNSSEQVVDMKEDAFDLSAGESRMVSFGVNVQSSTIESMLDEDEPVFNTGLHINATNQDLLVDIEETIEAEGKVSGIGPGMDVTIEQEEEIPVGESFELSYTLTNTGDEPVYDLETTVNPTVPNNVTHLFDEPDEALYYRQAMTSPGPSVSAVAPSQENLAPGESTTVTFSMKSSTDLKEGHLYFYNLNITAETRDGEQTWQSLTSVQAEQQEETSDQSESMFSGSLLWALIPIAILVVVILITYMMKKKPSSSEGSETEENDFEDFDEVSPQESEFKEDPKELSDDETTEIESEENQQETGDEESEETPWGDEPDF
uniref:Uncharacterized protein n=1 Tax=uncultured organism TaxID=155900 RepID=M1QAN6_9ZZZZ|nr:hypothetical protein FLSS-7_0027 [uncultured organism]